MLLTATLAPQSAPYRPYTEDAHRTLRLAVCVYWDFRGLESAGYGQLPARTGFTPVDLLGPAVDFKAAIRYCAGNELLPCSHQRFFVFGFAAGGGLSAVLGDLGRLSPLIRHILRLLALLHSERARQLSDSIYGSFMVSSLHTRPCRRSV